MINKKQTKFKTIKKQFKKHKVLRIEDLFKLIGTTCKRTVNRYMKEFDYLTSYTHKGGYYTLEESVEFDAHGLWHYEGIGFSKHNTLYNTITYFVERSETGMNVKELNAELHTETKYASLDLLRKEKLTRTKANGVYVYFSSDPDKAEKQIQRRKDIVADQKIDKVTCFKVLLAAFQSGENSPEQIAKYLKNQGSKISQEEVLRVFRRYELKKKT